MGVQYAEPFHIAYLDEATPLKELAAVTKQLAEQLNAAMGRAGYTGADSTSFVALSNKVTQLRADVDAQLADNAIRRKVVTYQDLGAGGTFPANTLTYQTTGRTIDPTAIFGAGWGAEVTIDARLLYDFTQTNGRGDYWLTAWDNATETGTRQDMVLDSQSAVQRGTFSINYTEIVAAGAIRRFRPRVEANNFSLVTYGSTAHNRMRCTVKPYKP